MLVICITKSRVAMKLKRATAAIVLVSGYAAPVAAGTFEDAFDAHARGDYAKALRLIRPGPIRSQRGVKPSGGHGRKSEAAERQRDLGHIGP